jgi:hypothetical protein
LDEEVGDEEGAVVSVFVVVAVDVAVAVADNARGSAHECGAILDALRVLNLVDNTRLTAGKRLLHRVVSMLVKMSA